MEKYSAVKSGKEPDLSDYKEYKLKEDNVGKDNVFIYDLMLLFELLTDMEK